MRRDSGLEAAPCAARPFPDGADDL